MNARDGVRERRGVRICVHDTFVRKVWYRGESPTESDENRIPLFTPSSALLVGERPSCCQTPYSELGANGSFKSPAS
jgi:hypothetical protein